MKSEKRLIELLEEIAEKRNQTFADSASVTYEKRVKYIAMVNAFDICISLLNQKLNEHKGEILKGGGK